MAWAYGMEFTVAGKTDLKIVYILMLASQVFVERSQSLYRSNIEPLSVVDRC